ncbi:membrane protein [Actinorhabdospora filicis]|uniref:Membrane protein n=1 Tax=Actinorhabdospora filicis TaxID=1785913 RepID=A0A9W6SIA1_9ACTN|nr:DoxX family membrane protein [Actinorhabdospora filicis]GLZ76021.1 membrane protein [Actinorhabdospora filicis]
MTGIAAHNATDHLGDDTAARSTATGRALAVLRIAIGWIFLWAFLDKLFGFGEPTPAGKGWIDGASPTAGYLKSVDGPLGGLFHNLSGQAWADWLFVGGLAGLGIALVLGIGLRVAAIGGFFLLVLLWASSLPLMANPFLDQHLVYWLAIVALAFANAGDTWGLGRAWARTGLVRKVPILR